MSDVIEPKPSEKLEQPATLMTQAAPPEPEKTEQPASAESATTVEPFSVEKFVLPEGFVITDEHKTALGEAAQKHGLSLAAVQDLTNLHVETVKAMQVATDSVWGATQKEWTDAVYAKYGGEEKARAAAARFAPIIDQFGGQALRDALNVTGFGNNPAAFDFFTKIVEKFGEATPVAAAAAPKASVNPLHAMYPTMVPKE